VHLRQMREDFSHSLIAHQAEERRRMAREVHDSTMQLLAGMGLSLGQLKRRRHTKVSGEIFEEMEQLLGEAQRELRAISFLAHAPEVSELGLPKALRQLAGGFGRRTGLNIAIHVDESVKISSAAEVAVYRMVQEALSNVHRHAQASDAAIGLHQRRSMLHIAVADNGKGMPEHVRRGVGLSSMRARIEELGGRLMIRAGHPGTVLIGDLAIAV
jgi:two-component system NarL family sensor kinase